MMPESIRFAALTFDRLMRHAPSSFSDCHDGYCQALNALGLCLDEIEGYPPGTHADLCLTPIPAAHAACDMEVPHV